MNVVAAFVATGVLAGIAVVQLLAVLGMPVGRMLWGGAHRVLPRRLRIGSAVSVVVYAAFAWVLLSRAGVVAGRDCGFVVVAAWVLLTSFAIGVVMNVISRSPLERAVMTPACALLAGATLVVAFG